MRAGAALCVVLGLAVAACERERRAFDDRAPEPDKSSQIVMTSLTAGPAPPVSHAADEASQFDGNAYHVNQGKALFSAFNCKGCHFNGGGGSGPPLMDDQWIYGGAIENIAHTIVEGRPNGMPSFRGRLTNEQVWELAAYVRSMSGNVRSDVAPGRNDAIHNPPAEQRRPPAEPKPGGDVPSAAEGRN